MASSYSLRFRLNYQAPGDNLNIWGLVLNTGVFQLLEDAIAKRLAFTLSGSKALTTAQGATDEARCAFLDVTGGTGGTITIPSVEKIYLVRNGASGDVVVTTGAGLTATLTPGEVNLVVSDASNVRPLGPNAQSVKEYVDAVAWTYNAGNLPAQAANAGKFLKTDGTNAAWQAQTPADLSSFGATAAQTWAMASALLAITPLGLKQSRAPVALAYGATVTPDLSLGRRFTLNASASFILSAPINASPGDVFEIMITNTAGGIVLAVAAAYNRENGLLVISPTNGHKNKLIFLVESVDGSNVGTDITYSGQRNRT